MLVLMIAILVSLGGCGDDKAVQRYGTAWNGQRATRGLPPVPADWKGVAIGREITYTPPDVRPENRFLGYPRHQSKVLEIDANGQILFEQDMYYSKDTYHMAADDRDMNKSLLIRYSYVEAAAGRDPWTVWGSFGEHDDPKLSLAEARAKLVEWGLPDEYEIRTERNAATTRPSPGNR